MSIFLPRAQLQHKCPVRGVRARHNEREGVIPVDIPNGEEILNHFGISETEGVYLSVFNSAKIENIGKVVAFHLAKTKGRAVIDYDPAFPFAVFRIFIDPVTNSN